MTFRVHILGASGSGTSTLASNLSERIKLKHLDTDDYYWKVTEVPFTEKNSVQTRLDRIREDIEHERNWVLSGSICSWGEPLIEHFTHVVFLWIPWNLRKERLQKRELERYGPDDLAVGGRMHQVNSDFMDWASKYDTAGLEQRSRITHDNWIDELPSRIKVIRIEEAMTRDALTKKVIEELNSNKSELTTPDAARPTS